MPYALFFPSYNLLHNVFTLLEDRRVFFLYLQMHRAKKATVPRVWLGMHETNELPPHTQDAGALFYGALFTAPDVHSCLNYRYQYLVQTVSFSQRRYCNTVT